MPYRDGIPTLTEQIQNHLRWREEVGPILKEANELARENKALRAALKEAVDALERLVIDYQEVPDPTDSDGQAVFEGARAACDKAKATLGHEEGAE